MKEGSKVKSDHTKRIPAHDFLHVVLPSQTSKTNNKRVISTFKFGYPRLTLKKRSKVKSDHINRLNATVQCFMMAPLKTKKKNLRDIEVPTDTPTEFELVDTASDHIQRRREQMGHRGGDGGGKEQATDGGSKEETQARKR